MSRKQLLQILELLPVRDEAEILQSAQALAYTTGKADELTFSSVALALKVLEQIVGAVEHVYNKNLIPTGTIVPLVVQSASSIIKATVDLSSLSASREMDYLKLVISQTEKAVERLILHELKYQVVEEEPLLSRTDYFSVMAMRHVVGRNQSLRIGDARFDLSQTLGTSLKQVPPVAANQECFQSHMTTFEMDPYSFEKKSKEVSSGVTGLSLYGCDGSPIQVDQLLDDSRIHVHFPNLAPPATESSTQLTLKKWSMNIHQFNVSQAARELALHLVVEFVPVNKGRLFPVTILISQHRSPSPSEYFLQFKFEPNQNNLDIFLPAGTFNLSGEYYIGIVDSTYNSKRLRPGEVTERNYTLKLWWGECLYWDISKGAWLSDGCVISKDSTFKVTKCVCTHLTAFGGRFELIPNELSLQDVEEFFSPLRNPVAISLISIVLVLYLVLFLWCRHCDQHDARKGGIVYLLDNAPMDQQKYEITLITGYRKEAGTTAKISLILHGEEGMSETRELISDDKRPLFERNSRDKFILSLPDSIGRIWKVQIWHNNHGESPSWFLSRVIVRDLNTGNQYFFLCEKWLAVEEQDGKVEREFMALDGPLDFSKAFLSKAVEYVADYHIWVSLITCPPYSGFRRTERLTLCVTLLVLYMCLNAMWYRTTVTEYRGEFGLLDLSWRNVTVGAICCIIIIPIGLLLEFLFRRSKPKNASSCHSKDEETDWDHEYPSGKPNEQESEDQSEHVPPIMTYSLLDQSILNWPNIQTWAQKQWMKRQQSVRSNHDNRSRTSDHSDNSLTNGLMSPSEKMAESALSRLGLSEMDQASSGFEDCSSLIRPKASVDSTRTTAAPSVAESMRTHKPKSLPDSSAESKHTSEQNSSSSSKTPSISSSGSTYNKSSVLMDRREKHMNYVYLPYWCRYIAWGVCLVLCVAGATVTIMYGYRFGVYKATLWLQSLYFSFMICVFIINPILILLAVIYTAINYKKDPSVFDSHSYDLFQREKAKEDLRRWKKQMELWEDGEALERGVAARQRSRYLRFARPPQEKQLIEARKRVMMEKKAMSIFRESVVFVITICLLLIMAYGKDTSSAYQLNSTLKNNFLSSCSHLNFSSINSRDDWFIWAKTSFLESLGTIQRLNDKTKVERAEPNNYILGKVQLRIQRAELEPCPVHLPRSLPSCLSPDSSSHPGLLGQLPGITFTEGSQGNLIFGKHGMYDGSGFVLSLNSSRNEAVAQIDYLQQHKWLDRQTQAVFVEFTLYNVPLNLFSAVDLFVEMSPSGGVFPVAKVTSAQLFRYVTAWDNVVLACELLFFVLMMLAWKGLVLRLTEQRYRYFSSPWNVLNMLICVMSLAFWLAYVYRFAIVATTIESLRSTYYEQYVDVSFITFWDEMLRSAVGILLFLSFVKCLRLLRYNKQFAIFGDVYRKARREIIIFCALFSVTMAAYTSLGHALFGSVLMTFRDLWSSLLGVTTLLMGWRRHPEFLSDNHTLAANVYLFTFLVFAAGTLTAYMVAVLTHYFKSRKKRRLLAMGGLEAILFYWERFQLWSGLRKVQVEEEPVIILPPEFTMAEIEYQVDELLFRMNALTGSHGLPEKPPCYLTDSDCTYGGGDDGISSGGSEGAMCVDDRLEQRVQKIEDNLCSQEPFLAQLLKLDSVGAEDLTHEKEKQLRSHLELEIFRQLQIQRQDLKSPTGEETTDKGDKSVNPEAEKEPNSQDNTNSPNSPGHDSTSSDETGRKQGPPVPPKPSGFPTSLTIQALQELIAKSTQEIKEMHNDNSSSNPESPKDKITFTRMNKNRENSFKVKNKQNSSSTSSSENADVSLTVPLLSETENIRKPTKPTFLHSRESSLSDPQKGSPMLKLRTSGHERGGMRSDPLGIDRIFESSSGSEQDGIHLGRKLLGKRSLRKTKSRGKGKGVDSLEPVELILDELEGEEGEICEKVKGREGLKQREGTDRGDKRERTEHTVQVDVHY